MNKKTLLISMLIMLLFPALSLSWQGKAVQVLDGDTVEVLEFQQQVIRIRLYGVATPEKKQAFGQKAKEFTLNLVGGKQVEVEPIDTDQYERTVGLVHVGNKCLNEELLKFGFAWYYGQYCKKDFCREWRDLETRAKVNKVGLWGDPHAQPPWEFRRKAKDGTKNTSNIKEAPLAASAYHGNVESHK